MSALYLVDDHALMRDTLRALLEAAGHRVVGQTGDPTQAIDEVQALSPALVLLDLDLGSRSGFEVLDALRERAPGVRTVVLTMSAQPRHVEQARRLGARAYVLKGSSAAELLAAIEAVRRGERVFPTAAAGAIAASAALSPREREVMAKVARGLSSRVIGEQLGLSPKTVESYRSRSMAKLGVADVPALVRLAVREGWIDPSAG